MHRPSLSILLTLATCGLLGAQTYVVSPLAYDGHEGDNNNAYPFANSAFRYQQGHGDLKGTPRVLTGIGWRRDGTLLANTGYGVRTLDIEVLMTDCDVATLSTTFANNYASAPVNTFLRKMVNTPDHTAMPVALPAPWDFNLVYDVPYVYLGLKDLLYEVVIYSNTNTAFYACDAAASTDTRIQGGFSLNGTGCTTSRGVMLLRATNLAVTTTSSWSLQWNVTLATPSAPSAVLVGLVNPNIPLPGLCTSLFTDGGLFNITGTTSTTGAWNTTALTVPYNPSLVNFSFTAQAAAIDATMPGIGVAASNGITEALPPLPGALQLTRIFASNNATALTGGIGTGYGLVTRFRI